MSLLIYFLLSALIGSCVIAGWHTVTRGKYEQMPDGRMKYTGMIFKGWSKYWEHYVMDYANPEKYSHKQLEILYSALCSSMGMTDNLQATNCLSKDMVNEPRRLYLPNAQSHSYFVNNLWRFSNNNPDVYWKIDKINDNGSLYISFTKLNRKYKFPEWIRKPISSCIYCYGSVYGTIMWVILAYTAGKDFTTTQLLALWVPYCLTCSIIAPRIWKGA